MSIRAVILGLSLVLFIFIGTYVGAFLMIYDTSSSPNDNGSTNTEGDQQLEYKGNLDKTEVIVEMHRIANQERQDRGLNGLVQDVDLQEVSMYKAEKMESERYISHTSPGGETVEDRFEKFNMNCRVFGENLAQTHYKKKIDANYGGTDIYKSEQELAQGVVNQFMASPGHKENILDEEWDQMAFGIDITEEGKVYVSQEFCTER